MRLGGGSSSSRRPRRGLGRRHADRREPDRVLAQIRRASLRSDVRNNRQRRSRRRRYSTTAARYARAGAALRGDRVAEPGRIASRLHALSARHRSRPAVRNDLHVVRSHGCADEARAKVADGCLMRDVFAVAARWLDEQRTFALATLVDLRDAATAPIGTTIAVDASGRVFGNIGAGCYEGEIVGACMKTAVDGETRRLDVNLTNDDEVMGGTACGAVMRLVVVASAAGVPRARRSNRRGAATDASNVRISRGRRYARRLRARLRAEGPAVSRRRDHTGGRAGDDCAAPRLRRRRGRSASGLCDERTDGG